MFLSNYHQSIKGINKIKILKNNLFFLELDLI